MLRMYAFLGSYNQLWNRNYEFSCNCKWKVDCESGIATSYHVQNASWTKRDLSDCMNHLSKTDMAS